MHTQSISVELLLEAEWNANRVRPGLLAKLRRSLEQFGVVENLVARTHPTTPGCFEVLSGNHRLRLLKELGHQQAPVVVVELDDARARLLAQTLNRTRGSDDPKAYARLLEEVLAELDVAEVTALLPETEATIEGVLREFGGGDTREEQLPALPALPRSRAGRDLRARCAPARVWRCDRPGVGGVVGGRAAVSACDRPALRDRARSRLARRCAAAARVGARGQACKRRPG